MADKVKTVAVEKEELLVELKKLRKIKNLTKKQELRKREVLARISAMNRQKIKNIRQVKAAKKAESLDPKPAPSVDTSVASAGTQQPPSSAADKRPTDTLEEASRKAKKARADEVKAKAAAEKAKLRKDAALKSEARQPQTAAQKKAAKDASVDIVPKRPKAKSSDTLGMAAKEGKAAQEKREEASRKRRAAKLKADASGYRINPMESPEGYADLSKAEKSAETAKMARALKKASSFDKDKDIFHKIAYGISQLTGQDPSVTYDDPAKFGDQTDSYGKKKGGKVTAKRPTAKKYAMSRGGKSASVRKPTRA